ncbi:MAG: hypothetical protein IJT22_04090, partial [Synergistaceae bacterium]|nr:hypothetical protein [Synergistaceae bacterium]
STKSFRQVRKGTLFIRKQELINLDYSFKTLVKEMRYTQKLYFKTRDKRALERSKELERQVDKNARGV